VELVDELLLLLVAPLSADAGGNDLRRDCRTTSASSAAMPASSAHITVGVVCDGVRGKVCAGSRMHALYKIPEKIFRLQVFHWICPSSDISVVPPKRSTISVSVVTTVHSLSEPQRRSTCSTSPSRSELTDSQRATANFEDVLNETELPKHAFELTSHSRDLFDARFPDSVPPQVTPLSGRAPFVVAMLLGAWPAQLRPPPASAQVAGMI